jgi:NAD+ kinase
VRSLKIILVSRIDEKEALLYTRQLGRLLAGWGHSVCYDTSTAQALGTAGRTFQESGAGLAVVVGGDGSILLAVQRMEHQIPVLGVNWGEVGFLADIEPAEAEKFLREIETGFPVEQRMRISLSKDGEFLGNALNEALIVTSRPAKMLRFVVVIDGVPAERFRADGLLISTPTGSTAYAMSAGGPIVDPRIEGVVLVPLAPYLLSSRPHVLSTDRTLEIRLESIKPSKLVIDGQNTFEFETAGSFTVKKADSPAIFVDAKKNFFEKVDRKLRRL